MNEAVTLSDIRWCLRSIVLEGGSIDGAAEAGADIVFDEGMASGRGGCNRFSSGYTLEGSNIRFRHIASTRMYCEETMAVEDAFFTALELVAKVSIEDGILRMASEDGTTLLVFERASDHECAGHR